MTDTPNVGKDMEELEFYYSLDFKMLQSLENILESLIKLDIHIAYDTVPATSLGHLPKRNENTCAYKDISTHMYTIALFSCYL